MFRVIDVPDEVDAVEQVGTKPKVWFHNNKYLFKYIYRESGHATGEDWSEKVSSVVRLTLLYIWRFSSESAPRGRSIQILEGFGCDCLDSL